MNEASILMALATVHFVALMSPGPDFALVVQNAARFGRRTGFYIALGLSLGIFLHALLSVTGISLLVQQHPVWFSLIQAAGGSYLLYLGVGALYATWQHWSEPVNVLKGDYTAALGQPHKAFIKGLVTNLLNPKALVFFASLMSSLVPVGMSLAGKSTGLLIIWSESLLWFGLLAWLLTKPVFQRRLEALGRYIDLACGVVFSVLGSAILYRVISFAVHT